MNLDFVIFVLFIIACVFKGLEIFFRLHLCYGCTVRIRSHKNLSPVIVF
jgi:hypothetical protein